MTDIPLQEIPTYSRKDFVSDQTVRWCPGCGDYAILAAVQKARFCSRRARSSTGLGNTFIHTSSIWMQRHGIGGLHSRTSHPMAARWGRTSLRGALTPAGVASGVSRAAMAACGIPASSISTLIPLRDWRPLDSYPFHGNSRLTCRQCPAGGPRAI